MKRLLLLMALAAPVVLAQAVPPPANSTDLNRKIELALRDRFEIPTACDIRIGTRIPSQFAGFDTLKVTLTQGKTVNEVEFLISKDNAMLARLDKLPLDHNPALEIDVKGRPVRGNPAAPVTIINFDDLECPVCARMHQILTAEVAAKYGPNVRFIYKDNPLVDLHPWALHAAVDAGCLAQQDGTAYWTFIDYVHTHGEEVSGEGRNLQQSFATLDRIAGDSAQAPRIDRPTLMACLKKQDESTVRQSMKEAAGLGLNFTPALFVNGEEVRGITTEGDPALAVDRALRASGASANQSSPK